MAVNNIQALRQEMQKRGLLKGLQKQAGNLLEEFKERLSKSRATEEIKRLIINSETWDELFYYLEGVEYLNNEEFLDRLLSFLNSKNANKKNNQLTEAGNETPADNSNQKEGNNMADKRINTAAGQRRQSVSLQRQAEYKNLPNDVVDPGEKDIGSVAADLGDWAEMAQAGRTAINENEDIKKILGPAVVADIKKGPKTALTAIYNIRKTAERVKMKVAEMPEQLKKVKEKAEEKPELDKSLVKDLGKAEDNLEKLEDILEDHTEEMKAAESRLQSILSNKRKSSIKYATNLISTAETAVSDINKALDIVDDVEEVVGEAQEAVADELGIKLPEKKEPHKDEPEEVADKVSGWMKALNKISQLLGMGGNFNQYNMNTGNSKGEVEKHPERMNTNYDSGARENNDQYYKHMEHAGGKQSADTNYNRGNKMRDTSTYKNMINGTGAAGADDQFLKYEPQYYTPSKQNTQVQEGTYANKKKAEYHNLPNDVVNPQEKDVNSVSNELSAWDRQDVESQAQRQAEHKYEPAIGNFETSRGVNASLVLSKIPAKTAYKITDGKKILIATFADAAEGNMTEENYNRFVSPEYKAEIESVNNIDDIAADMGGKWVAKVLTIDKKAVNEMKFKQLTAKARRNSKVAAFISHYPRYWNKLASSAVEGIKYSYDEYMDEMDQLNYDETDANEIYNEIYENEALVTGPGGHIPDGTGPYGRGMGPGQGRGDGSGMESLLQNRTYKRNRNPKRASVKKGQGVSKTQIDTMNEAELRKYYTDAYGDVSYAKELVEAEMRRRRQVAAAEQKTKEAEQELATRKKAAKALEIAKLLIPKNAKKEQLVAKTKEVMAMNEAGVKVLLDTLRTQGAKVPTGPTRSQDLDIESGIVFNSPTGVETVMPTVDTENLKPDYNKAKGAEGVVMTPNPKPKPKASKRADVMNQPIDIQNQEGQVDGFTDLENQNPEEEAFVNGQLNSSDPIDASTRAHIRESAVVPQMTKTAATENGGVLVQFGLPNNLSDYMTTTPKKLKQMGVNYMSHNSYRTNF